MNLMFSRQMKSSSRKLQSAFKYLRVVNVVMHATRTKKASRLRGLLLPPSEVLQSLKIDRSDLSTSEPYSPFEHDRYDAAEHGKILIFKKKGNIIRAGKNDVLDGFKGILFFLRWINDLDWPTTICAPNIVLLGEFKEDIPASIRDHYASSWSSKFPGIAINWPDTSCTPELYLSSNKFILPGVTGPAEATDILLRLHKLLEELRSSSSGISSGALRDAPRSEPRVREDSPTEWLQGVL